MIKLTDKTRIEIRDVRSRFGVLGRPGLVLFEIVDHPPGNVFKV